MPFAVATSISHCPKVFITIKTSHFVTCRSFASVFVCSSHEHVAGMGRVAKKAWGGGSKRGAVPVRHTRHALPRCCCIDA